MIAWLRCILLPIVVLLALSGTVQAVQPDEVLADPALEQRARDLSEGLRCMVCQNQSIDESDAPLARDLRLLVRERLVAGDTDRQVEDYLVSRYGEFVLMQPRFSWATAALWTLPAIILAAAVAFLLSSRRRQPATAKGLTAEEERRIAELLDRRN
jgi:cytochrome c-type biogenesis protein CcmH